MVQNTFKLFLWSIDMEFYQHLISNTYTYFSTNKRETQIYFLNNIIRHYKVGMDITPWF